MLVTNRFDAEYIDQYFDQNVNYFILTGICKDADACLEMEELFDWGYWTKDDFEKNSMDQALLVHAAQHSLIRFSTIENEEDMLNEFKEVTDQSIMNSIRENLAKTAAAFLNNRGGAIYFGISDSGEVRGFKTDRRRRDEIAKLAISIIGNITTRFPPDAYSIKFIPIIEMARYRMTLYVSVFLSELIARNRDMKIQMGVFGLGSMVQHLDWMFRVF